MLSEENYDGNHITHCTFDSQILTTVDGRSNSYEISAPRFRAQRLQRHAL